MSSQASVPFPPARTALTRLAGITMVAAPIVAMVVAGAALFGHSHSVAASQAATSIPDTASQLATVSGTDPSVPQASAVFSRQEGATEEDAATF